MLTHPMSPGLPREDDERPSDPTLEASGTITPDAFLAEVARIAPRSAPTSDPPLHAGETIGHFVIERELGRGGMGVVYAAEDVTLGRTVALKVLPVSDDEGRRKRFLREARAAAALTHPGIAMIHEIGEFAGRVFIAMELVRGETLRARMAKGALPIADTLTLARDIARALARAHERGVVHRDLKPENVMIGEDGPIKLLDFGLAKPIVAGDLATATTATENGRLLGTPTYMSPEQAKGREVDVRSDVFSFGVMLYEMLAGRRPFAGASVVELFIALDRVEPAPPSRGNPGVPAALERVVLRCLRKDPAQRYADAGALLRDLEPITLGEGRGGRGRLGLVAAAIGLVAAVAVAAAAVPRASPRPRGIAPAPITDLPAPRSKHPEAIAAYQAGLRSMREGNPQGSGFRRAIELDPELAAAHAQLATVVMGHAMEPAREHFRKAEALRDRLSERDQAMLDALEPLVQRQPADWAEANRRLAAAVDRFPGDAELWHLLGLGRANYDDFEAAVRDQRKAIEIDPGFAQAYSTLGMDLAYLGRFDEALGAVEQCLAIAPASLACMHLIAKLRSERGECDAMEAMARRMIAAGAPPRAAYATLAEALAARGASLTSVREALRQAEQGVDDDPDPSCSPETGRKRNRLALKEALAELTGDFDTALHAVEEYAPTLEKSTQQSERGALASALARLYVETGRDEEAARVAVDFLDRRDAWEPAPGAEDVAMAGDASPALLLAALRGGAIARADFDARRDAFRRTWTARMTPVTKNFLWVHGYAAMVQDENDARAALAALPTYSPIPPFRPEAAVDDEIGRTFLLAGRTDDAIAWLERATRKCSVLPRPLHHVRALATLGDARAAKGDIAGACAAYGAVLARWGEATPRSVTAEHARAERAALGCE